jgi:hypothetical protein
MYLPKGHQRPSKFMPCLCERVSHLQSELVVWFHRELMGKFSGTLPCFFGEYDLINCLAITAYHIRNAMHPFAVMIPVKIISCSCLSKITVSWAAPISVQSYSQSSIILKSALRRNTSLYLCNSSQRFLKNPWVASQPKASKDWEKILPPRPTSP